MLTIKNFTFKKDLKKIFNWSFFHYSLLIANFLLIFFLMLILFLPYTNGQNLKYGDILNFGFYQLTLKSDKNILSLSPFAFVFSILTIGSVVGLCYSYWRFKNSDNFFYYRNHAISVLYGLIILFILFLVLLNFMNREVIDLKEKNIVQNGFWNDLSKNFEIFKFNYIYNILLVKINTENISLINWKINNFGIVWIFICVFGYCLIIITFITNEYFKNKFKIKDINYEN